MKNFKKGFTLIELLIVIALLGALAVGLLAALDPFEQLKKGKDTGIRNTVSELHGAIIRYYAITNLLPWGTTSLDWGNVSTLYNSASLTSVVDSGELKKDFSTLAKDQLQLIRMGSDSSTSLTVCFKPDSKSFRTDLNTKFSDTGVPMDGAGESCELSTKLKNLTSPTYDCWWCVK